MSRWSLRGRHVALLCSIAAIAAAGCGSSSSKSKPASPAASTPAATSAPATPSTSTSTPAASAEPTTGPNVPVSSATYKDAYIKKLQAQGIPSGKATKVVNCVITGIEAKGIKTVGEILQHKDQFTTVANECQKKTGIA